jgi:antitoxin (DNA-binding transcriptional repressor) of toxin-antitoxin stability system
MGKRRKAGDISIEKAGTPLVPLTPAADAPAPRRLGTAKGDFVVPDDFDAPLPARVLDAFER